MFEQAFRNIDDALRKDAGCTTELDEQTSWLLFQKYLDGSTRSMRPEVWMRDEWPGKQGSASISIDLVAYDRSTCSSGVEQV